MPDAYLSVGESIRHAGFAVGATTTIEWLEAERVPTEIDAERIRQLDGIVVPGGFGERGVEGMIAAARIAREHDIPYLGLCLGMQVMVVEFARHCLGLSDAHSTEISLSTSAPVIALMAEQMDVTDLGGTMRLGACPAMLDEGSVVAGLYGTTVVSERHRHRYEFNSRYRDQFEAAGMRCSGTSPDGRLVEFVEIAEHPFFVGTQAHPEFKSRPGSAAPAVPRPHQGGRGARRRPRAAHPRPGIGRRHAVSEPFRVVGTETLLQSHVFGVEQRTVEHDGDDLRT